MKQAFCLTGMHRSGTSVTACWLEQCGLIISDGKKIQPATGNPKGHFEDIDFVNLQAAMIKSIKPKSKGWIILEGAQFRFSDSALKNIEKLIAIRNEKYDLWGWKDPRTVLFLQHWKKIIPDLKVILLWRPFEEVIASLLIRSRQTKPWERDMKINIYEAAKIWFHYNNLICLYKQMYPEDTLLFSLEDILNNNQVCFELIEQLLGIGLHYQPITNIYQKNLRSSQKYVSMAAKIIKPFLQKKAARTEEALLKLSNTPELAKNVICA